jgi:hypothetical protein
VFVLLIEITFEQSLEINLSAEEVFDYIGDPGNMVEWACGMIAMRKVSAGELGVGTLLQSTVRFLGRWWDMTFEIIEYESDRCLTLKSIMGISPCLFCYRLVQDEHGSTVISREAVIQFMEGIIDLNESVIIKAVRRQLEYDLLTLKDILEARAFPCGVEVFSS